MMAQTRIQDGLARLVEHFLANKDDPAYDQTLEVCKRLLERYPPYNDRDLMLVEKMMMWRM